MDSTARGRLLDAVQEYLTIHPSATFADLPWKAITNKVNRDCSTCYSVHDVEAEWKSLLQHGGAIAAPPPAPPAPPAPPSSAHAYDHAPPSTQRPGDHRPLDGQPGATTTTVEDLPASSRSGRDRDRSRAPDIRNRSSSRLSRSRSRAPAGRSHSSSRLRARSSSSSRFPLFDDDSPCVSGKRLFWTEKMSLELLNHHLTALQGEPEPMEFLLARLKAGNVKGISGQQATKKLSDLRSKYLKNNRTREKPNLWEKMGEVFRRELELQAQGTAAREGSRERSQSAAREASLERSQLATRARHDMSEDFETQPRPSKRLRSVSRSRHPKPPAAQLLTVERSSLEIESQNPSQSQPGPVVSSKPPAAKPKLLLERLDAIERDIRELKQQVHGRLHTIELEIKERLTREIELRQKQQDGRQARATERVERMVKELLAATKKMPTCEDYEELRTMLEEEVNRRLTKKNATSSGSDRRTNNHDAALEEMRKEGGPIKCCGYVIGPQRYSRPSTFQFRIAMLGFWKDLNAFAWISALLILASPVSAASDRLGSDACTVILKKNNVFKAEEALRCLSPFKVDRTYRTEQITALKGYLNVYPYLHLQKTAPTNIDAMKELDAIANNDSIQLEIEFHANVSFLLNRFRDPHATYTSACFNNIVYRQPWSLEAVHPLDKPNAPPRIFVRGPVTDGFNDKDLANKVLLFFMINSGVDIRSYRGWEVAEINGKSAYDAIRNYSDTYIRTSRDPNTRFNVALLQSQYSNDGKLVLREGEFVKTNVFPWGWELAKTYKLVNPRNGQSKVVTAPWMGVWKNDDVKSMFQYYKDYCTVGGSNVKQRITDGDTMEEEKSNLDDLVLDSRIGEEAADVDLNPGLDDVVLDSPRPIGINEIWEYLGARNALRRPHGKLHRRGDNSRVVEEATDANLNPDLDDVVLDSPRHIDINEIWKYLAVRNARRRPHGKLHRRGDISIDWFTAPENPSLLRHQLDPVFKTPYLSAYVLEDGNVGVLKLGTFSFDRDDENITKIHLPQGRQALQTLVDRKVKKVILDLSGNGGGLVDAAIYFLNALFPAAKPPRFDIRLSKEHAFLLTVGKHLDENLFNLKDDVIDTTRTLGTTDQYSMLDRKHINLISRGGIREPYSGPFEYNSTTPQEPFRHSWSSKDVVVLTNGHCGSACALLSRALRNSAHVRHYVYGGFTHTPFQPSSFEGGCVETMRGLLNATTAVLSYAQSHRIPVPRDAVFPKPFKLPVEDSKMLVWESYSAHGGNVATPDEFVYQPADGYVRVERPAEIVTVWRELARMVGAEEARGVGEVEREGKEDEAARRWGV
ncbi:hypothetical protein HDU96_000663 [Phlyctochytrium bullatum]|nr:hypothetical protein HDU96_000663 [Phlyctochytrium bullatum]